MAAPPCDCTNLEAGYDAVVAASQERRPDILPQLRVKRIEFVFMNPCGGIDRMIPRIRWFAYKALTGGGR